MAQTNIDDSQVGKALLDEIQTRKAKALREAELKNQLLKRVITIQNQKSENPQKVLDSQYFNGLSLTEKIQFLNQNKDMLSRKPSFAWGNVGKDAVAAGSMAAIGTLLHQIMSNAGAAGFKPSMWPLGAAATLGTVVGATLSASRERKDYNKDLETQRNIDDAIATLVNRSLRPVPTRTDYVAKVRSGFEDMPLNVGKRLSAVDFSKID